jgi:hypothetical protein
MEFGDNIDPKRRSYDSLSPNSPGFVNSHRPRFGDATAHPERQWGRATELAETYNLSRTLLYQLRDRAAAVLAEVLSPHQPGPQAQGASLVIDQAFIQRAVVILSLLKGTVRDIQNGLDLLFGVERSVGYISQTLNAAGAQATVQNQALVVPVPILGEADEIFQGRKPCLTLVDGRSFLVLNLTPADSRDATTWGVTYLELLERGILSWPENVIRSGNCRSARIAQRGYPS